jgi:hypothetical protein
MIGAAMRYGAARIDIEADRGVWRVAFAFDPRRRAILLVADDKSGVKPRRFYRRLIATADERFDTHLKRIEKRKR